MAEKQIKSKKRVADHGEVFTNEREVNAMLDLVKDETERIESTFLEPACGEGAFLIEILNRKLKVVKAKYGKNEYDYEKYSIMALTSMYGVDLLEDNAKACRKRLFDFWDKQYTKNCKSIARDEVREAAAFILEKNILVGDALDMKLVDDRQNKLDDPIVFAEWTLVTGNKINRRDFRFDVILTAEQKTTQLSFMADDAAYFEKVNEYYEENPITHEIIPKPIDEYELVDYWEVQHNVKPIRKCI